jgi:hypothetical protein
VAIHSVVAVVTTFPLVVHLGDRIPVGQEPAATVPFFNLWSLTWTAQRLPHLLRGWWDAPIFWPARGTYASSELQPLTGLVFAVLRPVAGPAAAYGLILLGALALDGLAAGFLARRLGASEGASIAAGVLTQTLPFVFQQLGVLQLLMLWPVLLTIERLLAWAASGQPRDAAGIGLGVAVTYLTCGYFAVLIVLCALVASPLLLQRTWLADWRPRALGVVAAAAGALPLVPFALGQQHRLSGVRWTDATIRLNSSSWSDLAPGGTDFVGFALLALAAVGVIAGRRRPAVRFLLGLVVVATLVALGPRLEIAGWQPYGVLVDHVSAFAHLRSPFRATVLAQVSLAVLAALGVDALWSGRSRTWGPAAVGVALVLAVVTTDLGPGRLVPPPDRHTRWIDWLSDHPGGAVVALPPAPGGDEEDFEATTAAMVQSLEHGHPLVNGYTAFFPSRDEVLRDRLAAFPTEAIVRALRRDRVSYAVADAGWWDGERAAAARALGVRTILRGPDVVLLDLRAGPR